MRPPVIWAIAMGFTAVTLTQAGAQQMYRWVDKQGKVHYTQTPPPRDAAKSVEQRRLSSGAPPDGSSQMPFAVRQAVQNFPVSLYTAPDCQQACTEARNLLNKRGVPFREISVTDEASSDGLKKVTGDARVPVMLIGRSMEKGFEEGAYNAALDAAGYPRTSAFTGKPPALPAPKPATKPAAAPTNPQAEPAPQASESAQTSAGAPDTAQPPPAR